MKKIIEDLPKISCEHRSFAFNELYDKLVSAIPENATLYYDCQEITIWQQRRGIGRYFFSHKQIGEPEPPIEPDSFLAGLVGEEEPDRAQEFNEIAMGAGDGEAEIPF